MAERISKVETTTTAPTVAPTTAEGRATVLFLTSPAEFLCSEIALQLAASPSWKALFGDSIDPYKRMDYSERSLPALRVYTNGYQKLSESWFVEGDVTLDIILPASIRRKETEQFPDTIAGALLQQFRRIDFFNGLSKRVPAINELGKLFRVDKTLAFEWGDDQLVPLTQINLNFKMDLRIWDDYLESDYRDKGDPFERTLADLRSIATTIRAVNDDGTDAGIHVEDLEEIR